jgi:hypothetical protein
MTSSAPESILACVDAEIDNFLFSNSTQYKGYSYKQKRSCIDLSRGFDGYGLVTAIYSCIERNLIRRPNRNPSPENWKLCSENRLNAASEKIEKGKNKSNEVTLERAIVEKWPRDWTYQMPVASGLFGSTSDKRRSVDLVYIKQKDKGYFDFVELKIASDTPLYAAMEILGYGLVYYASRQDKGRNLQYEIKDLPVLGASKITLCVLAPADFYRPYNLKWLQEAINDGLERLVGIDSLKISFRFEKFEFQWNHTMSGTDLPKQLNRIPVY